MQSKARKGYRFVRSFFGKYEEIPEEWNVQKIKECCQILDSQRIPLNSEQRDKMKGNIPYYGSNGVQDYINKHIFDDDLILLAEDGGNFFDFQTRPIAYMIHGKSWVNNHAHVLKNKDGVSLEWIYYSIVHKNIIPWINGATRTKLNQSDLREIKILIPPIKEQQKIASILSGVDALIESTQKTVEGAERLKKGLMQKLLTRGINHKKFKRVKSLFGRYEEIPASWSKRSLGELGKLSAGGTPSRNNKSYWENGTIPWVSSGEIKNKRIRRTEEKITKKGLEKSATKLFPRGTVLIAITGFGKTRGRSGILDIDAATNQSIVGIMSKKVVNEFLWYVLQDRYQILRNFAQGTQQPGLNLEILSNHKIFVSNDTNEQQKIASILTGVDARDCLIHACIA